jgi:hypothetical protein
MRFAFFKGTNQQTRIISVLILRDAHLQNGRHFSFMLLHSELDPYKKHKEKVISLSPLPGHIAILHTQEPQGGAACFQRD